jgi:hypothetical protein
MATAFGYIVRLLINSPTARLVASNVARYAARQATLHIIRNVNARTKSVRTVQ